jgi:hypothetical protein
MAFEQVSFKLPREYIDYIKACAGADDESQGYIVQCAIYEQGQAVLPRPRRRDKRKAPDNE